MPLVNGQYVNPGGTRPVSSVKPTSTPQTTGPQGVSTPTQPWTPDSKTGPNGESLPQGAKAWTPQGTPYFGDGTFVGDFVGKLREYAYNFNKSITGVTPEQWQSVSDEWKQAIAQSQKHPLTPGGYTPEGAAAASEGTSAIVHAAQLGIQASEAEKSPIKVPAKILGVGLQALGDLFQVPAQKTEQALGALGGFREAINKLQSPLPALGDNLFTKGIEENPIGIGYDLLRVVFSPSANKEAVIGQAVDEGWNSGRVLYSQLFDKTLREQYLNEYRNGGDPNLIAMKLQNPTAEMVGKLLLDPLNVVGAVAKATEASKMLGAAQIATRATPELAEAISSFSKVTGEIDGAQAFDKIAEVYKAGADSVANGKLLKQAYNLNSLTTTSRQAEFIRVSKDTLFIHAEGMRELGFSPDEIVHTIMAGVKSVSKDSNEAKDGLATLIKNPLANTLTSADSQATWIVLRKMLENESGAVDGSKIAHLFGQQGNFDKFVENASALLTASAKNNFADVSEMAKAKKLVGEAEKIGGTVSRRTQELAKSYDQVPFVAKFANTINESLIGKTRGWINGVMGRFYFNLQGGVAVKNIASNNIFIGVDQGLSAFAGTEKIVVDGKLVSVPKIWTDAAVKANLDSWLHFEAPSTKGFETLAASQGGGKEFLFGKLMSAGESTGSARVVDSVFRDSMRKLLTPEMALGKTDELARAGMDKQAIDHLIQLVYAEKGDKSRVMSAFRSMHAGETGNETVDSWRMLDFLTPKQREILDEHGMLQPLTELAKGGQTTSDVEAAFTRMKTQIQEYASLATKDVAGMSQDNPGLDIFAKLSEMEKEGALPEGSSTMYASIMEQSHVAAQQYKEALLDAYSNVQRELGQTQEAMDLNAQYKSVMSKMDASGALTAQDTNARVKSAWEWTNQANGGHLKSYGNQNDPATWQKIWDAAGLEGEAPLDVNKQSFLGALWQQTKDYQSSAWNKHFDTIFSESENLKNALGKHIDATSLDSIFSQARWAVEKAQAYRKSAFEGGQLMIDGLPVPPAHADGAIPSFGRAWNESANGLNYLLDTVKNEITSRWGQKASSPLTGEIEAAISKYLDEAAPRIVQSKLAALKYADAAREFTLLNYGKKTYADVAASWIMPYHFFYTHQYSNWIKRIALDPEVIAGYAKYRTALETLHAGMPDFYKQNVTVNNILGVKLDHPLFFNLESSINPLYGLTGTDYNDPQKRVNWWTNTLDDMGKFGPTMWAPLQFGTALALAMGGQAQAASAWGSRLIPETQPLKQLTSLVFGKPVETDPEVLLFNSSGTFDPFNSMDTNERSRVGRSLYDMINQKVEEVKASGMSPEQQASLIGDLQAQYLDAARSQSGPLWQQAYAQSENDRSGPYGANLASSWILGVGAKARNQSDVQIDQMYTDMNQLYAMNTNNSMTADQYKQGWLELAQKYPFMDVVLLSKKGGVQRDAAYAYNVLSRIPPGSQGDVFKSLGLSQDAVNRFYDSKGFTDKTVTFTDTERQRFMSAVTDLGAMLKIPGDATTQEWNLAKSTYRMVSDGIAQQLGPDIWDKVTVYFNLKDAKPQDGKDFLSLHPEVSQALQMKQEAVVQIPILSAYYGGIDTLEHYVDGNVRSALEKKFGKNITQEWNTYYALQMNDALNKTKTAKAFYKEHPELKEYSAAKKILDNQANQAFVRMGSQLPQGQGAGIRSDFVPASDQQQGLLNALAPAQKPDWATISQTMQPALRQIVINYWKKGTKIPYAASNELDYIASVNGYKSGKDLLRQAGLALRP